MSENLVELVGEFTGGVTYNNAKSLSVGFNGNSYLISKDLYKENAFTINMKRKAKIYLKSTTSKDIEKIVKI